MADLLDNPEPPKLVRNKTMIEPARPTLTDEDKNQREEILNKLKEMLLVVKDEIDMSRDNITD